MCVSVCVCVFVCVYLHGMGWGVGWVEVDWREREREVRHLSYDASGLHCACMHVQEGKER